MVRPGDGPSLVQRVILRPGTRWTFISPKHQRGFPMLAMQDIARDYAAMMKAGETLAAAEKYWATDINCFEPTKSRLNAAAIAIGKPAALARLKRWLADNAMSDVLIDGPFITGDQFALFIDLEITRRGAGTREPFSEIATYTVRNGLIVEERFFYG